MVMLAVVLTPSTRVALAGDAAGTLPFPSEFLWSVAVSAAPSVPPLAADGHLFLALSSGVLSARRLTDGREVWTASLAVDQPLAAQNSLVFVASDDGVLARSAIDGVAAWQSSTGKLTAPPLVRGGWVIVAASGRVIALRASDGMQLWTRDVGAVQERPAIDGPTLYVPIVDGRLLALQLESGNKIWEVRIDSEPTEPLPYGDRLYVGSNRQFYCLKSANGEVDWRPRIGARVIGPAVADMSHVYFVAMDNVLRALDRRNGALRWTQPLPFRPSAGPVIIGGHLTVPGLVSELRAFDPANGRPAGKAAFGDPLASTPAFIDAGAGARPAIAAVIGGLERKWKLAFAVPPGDPVGPAIAPLTALPGLTRSPGI